MSRAISKEEARELLLDVYYVSKLRCEGDLVLALQRAIDTGPYGTHLTDAQQSLSILSRCLDYHKRIPDKKRLIAKNQIAIYERNLSKLQEQVDNVRIWVDEITGRAA